MKSCTDFLGKTRSSNAGRAGHAARLGAQPFATRSGPKYLAKSRLEARY
jgi:hypothetical protein